MFTCDFCVIGHVYSLDITQKSACYLFPELLTPSNEMWSIYDPLMPCGHRSILRSTTKPSPFADDDHVMWKKVASIPCVTLLSQTTIPNVENPLSC